MRSASNYRSAMMAALAAVFTPLLPASVNSATALEERRLSFYHTHTRETLNVTYAVNGEYVDSALAQINEFLSDFRTGDVELVDPELLDLIHDVRESLNSSATFEIISAYRSPKTNEMLRSQSSGVARNSQHVLGKAIDVRLRGIETSRLRDTAIELQRGGVGYYAQSNFVHLDTGRVRRW
ncbi:MAG: DUF882 domain-containing protein [Gammaproteobacteria bacterium]|nr:DUF882 domain-containing protein [Gammaproteobacteria bacterium]